MNLTKLSIFLMENIKTHCRNLPQGNLLIVFLEEANLFVPHRPKEFTLIFTN